MNYEFDTKDLVCLALSSVVGVWYLLRKVSEPQLSLGATGLRLGFGMQDHGTCHGTQISFSCCFQHWIANNLFGLAFSLNGVELLHLNNVSTGCILLGGLFIYDVFWVNGSVPWGRCKLQPLAEGMCVALCLYRGSMLAGHTLSLRISTSSAQKGVVGMMTECGSANVSYKIFGLERPGRAGISSGSLAVVGCPCVQHIPSW